MNAKYHRFKYKIKNKNKKKNINNNNSSEQKVITNIFTKAEEKNSFGKPSPKKFNFKRKKKLYLSRKIKNRFHKSTKHSKAKKISNAYKYFLIFILFLLYLIIFIYYERYDLIIGSIKVGFYANSIRFGGVERVMALLINLLSTEKYINVYLITYELKSEEEYTTPNKTKRICLYGQNKTVFNIIEEEKLDIIVYNFYSRDEIQKLNSLTKTKAIMYDHSSFLYWIFRKKFNFYKTPYPYYKNSKYVISLIPVENDYLFKKWGINSILMDNPTTFDYDSVIPSDLSSKIIIMIGRIEDPVKRYDLGIRAMPNIIQEIPDCQMKIISSKNNKYKNLIRSLRLEDKVKFTRFQKDVQIYLKNASLHIFPSISECYPMVLGEAKIFGIPTILCGLDYLALAKGGTVIIYDDNPDTIAKEAIKILKNETYRKQLGKEARESMKNHKNKIIKEKWIKLILSIYKGDNKSYSKLNSHKIMTEDEANIILENQLMLLKKRRPRFRRIKLEKFKHFYLKNK